MKRRYKNVYYNFLHSFSLNYHFTEKTSLDELQKFCDSFNCPNYSYSDVLKLHAYYISKKDIKLKDIPKDISDDQIFDLSDDEKQYDIHLKSKNTGNNSSDDFGYSDSGSFDENDEKLDVAINEEFKEQQTKRNKKDWSENEIECLISGVNEFGNQWQKIIKSNPGIFFNKTSANLRNKASQLKKDSNYSHLFNS